VANGEVRALRISEAAFLPILPKVQMVLLEDTLKLESLRKALDCETLNVDDIGDTLDAFETKTFSKYVQDVIQSSFIYINQNKIK
jgi:hypothetical protein